MQQLCQEYRLLEAQDNLVRIPFLVKGKLVVPPEVPRTQIVAAFDGAQKDEHYARLAQAQVLRFQVIDRQTMKYSGDYQYLVMPLVHPADLIESDFDALASGPYALDTNAVLAYLQAVAATWQANPEMIARVRQLTHLTNELPDIFLDAAFVGLQMGFDPGAARRMIDSELSFWGIPGSQFLDGRVTVEANPLPGITTLLGQNLTANPPIPSAPLKLTAMPTRQLHITAGNAPEVPIISALRAVLTRSPAVIKSPAECTLSGALMALAVAAALPDHPLTRHLSIVYWPGGDERIEGALFAPGAFDRVIVWGAPQAVASVQARALYTKVIALNPRYGVSLVGQEAFSHDLQQVATLGAQDSLIYNQKACDASLIHYVEGSPEQARSYAECLQRALLAWDELAPPFVPPGVRGQVKRMQRGKYARATWLLNLHEGEYTSGVLLTSEAFDVLDHPMSRLIVVRTLDDLQEALRYLHAGVSTVGVYPETLRLDLAARIAARGVSSVLPLGSCDTHFPGQPQDGMRVLSEMVDWKISAE